MRHNVFGRKLNRDVKERKALFRSLVKAFIDKGRIKTTYAKARAVGSLIEKLVTKAKDGSRASMTQLMSFFNHKEPVKKLTDEIAPRFKDKIGGYIRNDIIKTLGVTKEQYEKACHILVPLLSTDRITEEEFWQSLKIPYRVIEMCTADLGAQAVKKYDLEAWLPGRNDWGEITSTSNTTDYQARRLNIKYKKGAQSGYAHTLNGTLVATSRAIIAILENYQQKDGSVKVPEVLQPYLGKKVIASKGGQE